MDALYPEERMLVSLQQFLPLRQIITHLVVIVTSCLAVVQTFTIHTPKYCVVRASQLERRSDKPASERKSTKRNLLHKALHVAKQQEAISSWS